MPQKPQRGDLFIAFDVNSIYKPCKGGIFRSLDQAKRGGYNPLSLPQKSLLKNIEIQNFNEKNANFTKNTLLSLASVAGQKYIPIPLQMPNPAFDSELTRLVIELERLRSMRLKGSTHPAVFSQLKQIFHTLESIGSARIEGNNTTIAQFIETKLEDRPLVNENVTEIRNIEKAMAWIDDIAPDHPINRAFVSELHKMIVSDLTPPPGGEGDHTPGNYREKSVAIAGATHLPPPPYLVAQLMDELLAFINEERPQQFDLLRVAVAHHRFMWTHPFGNGNGRTGRLFTYAMLVKAGFQVSFGQILNPTAVFCIDRNRYNQLLAAADTGARVDLEDWCIYVLEGLSREIAKIERLAQQDYVSHKLLIPALDYSRKMKYIDPEEHEILKVAARQSILQAQDVRQLFPDLHPTTISRKLRGLRDKKMLSPETPNGTKYHLSFANNFLMRGIIQALEAEGFIPFRD